MTTWQNPLTGRFKLPPDVPIEPAYDVACVAPGWLEASSDPSAPHLPVQLRLQTGRRLALDKDAGGVAGRFGARPGDRLLLTVTATPGGSYLRLVALDCLEVALRVPVVRPAFLLQADGWRAWYEGVVERAARGTDPVATERW